MKFKKVFAAALAVVTLCGCGNTSTSQGGQTGQVVQDSTLEVALTTPYLGLSPLGTNDTASTWIIGQMYEGLYTRKIDGSGFEPLLAAGLPEKVPGEENTVTIKLKPNIKFHNGEPLNAQQVIYTFEQIKLNKSGLGRPSIVASFEEVTAVDDLTVKIKMSYDDGVLLAKLSHENAVIVDRKSNESQDLMINPVGTGPYKFVSAISGAEVKLVRNEEYWGEKGSVKDVTFSVVPEVSTAVGRLETGDAHVIPTVPVEQIARIEAMQDAEVLIKEGQSVNYLALRANSSKNPVMENLEFRKAIAMSIDRDGYIATLQGHATRSNSLVGPKIFGYKHESETVAEAESYGYQLDIEAAKKIIKDNGWEGQEITYLTSSTESNRKMAEFIQGCIQKIGVTVKLDIREASAANTAYRADNEFDMFFLGWMNVTGDGTELLEPNFVRTYSNGKQNDRVRYNNDEFEDLVQKSKTTSDSEARINYLKAANKKILEDAVVVPMYHAELIGGYASNVKGFDLDGGAQFSINDIDIIG